MGLVSLFITAHEDLLTSWRRRQRRRMSFNCTNLLCAKTRSLICRMTPIVVYYSCRYEATYQGELVRLSTNRNARVVVWCGWACIKVAAVSPWLWIVKGILGEGLSYRLDARNKLILDSGLLLIISIRHWSCVWMMMMLIWFDSGQADVILGCIEWL